MKQKNKKIHDTTNKKKALLLGNNTEQISDMERRRNKGIPKERKREKKTKKNSKVILSISSAE